MRSLYAGTCALALAATLTAGCKTTANPRPVQPGDWHLDARTGAAFSSTDGGDLGDNDVLEGTIQGGQFLDERLLLEGGLTASFRSTEFGTGLDNDTDVLSLGAGVRYYFDTESSQRPYLAGQLGLANVDVDIDGGADDSDSAPFVQIRGGIESFITDTVAVDFGLAFQEVIDVEIEGVDDDLTTIAAFVGISIWL